MVHHVYNGIVTYNHVVNGDAFNKTFNKPSQTMIGTIVSIYNSEWCHQSS